MAIAALAAVTALAVGLDATVGLPGGVLGGRLLEGGSGSSALEPTPRPATPPEPAPVVLAPASGGTVPDPAVLARRLDQVLAPAAVGHAVSLSVTDVTTGTSVYDRTAGTGRPPASTAKLLTALAALQRLGPGQRLTTRVVEGPPTTGGASAGPAEIVLVGGGDPSLRRVPGGGDPSLRDLARRTAKALAAQGVTRVRLRYDASLFAGPTASPAWPETYVSSGVVGPVVALSVDDGHTPDPARVAADVFASELRTAGLTVRGKVSAAVAGDGASEVASVQSRPVAELLEHTLTVSDNDYAEAFGHLVAVAAGEPATFEGAAAATLRTVQDLGVTTAGVTLHDASGLARGDRVPSVALTQVLGVAASPDHPTLASVLTGLPVAAFSGTLENRFVTGLTSVGAGVVRAKTGTLTGVSALAGTVLDRDGRLLAFAFLVDRSADGGALEVPAVLDRAATVLATCGCG